MEDLEMKTSKTIIFALLLAVLFSAQSTVLAQEEKSQETPYWYVLSFKIPWAKVDSLEKLVKKYTFPIVAELKKTGSLLDYRVFIHHTGGEYNLVILEKYPSWAAINVEGIWKTAFEAIEPDKSKRDEVNASFDWIFEGAVHKDNIYRELTE
jgi:hypothetical protein